MVWRDEVEIDAVEYSDRPKEDGPTPTQKQVERGEVAEVTLSRTGEEFLAEFQFWRETDIDARFTVPSNSAAGYLAWRIGDQHGHYGWLDMATFRVWLGMESFADNGQRYDYVDIGEDWRDKFFWNDFVDRLYSEFLEYPYDQASDLRVTTSDDLVDAPSVKSEVFEVDVECLSQEETCRFQLWRPEESQVVFFAVDVVGVEQWYGKKGNFHRGNIMSDLGFGVSLDEETETEIYELMDELRESGMDGFTVKQGN